MYSLIKIQQTRSLNTYPVRDLPPHGQSPAAVLSHADQPSDKMFTPAPGILRYVVQLPRQCKSYTLSVLPVVFENISYL